jgi:hypothetical protein
MRPLWPMWTCATPGLVTEYCGRYFSWTEHPFNLPFSPQIAYDGPPDKVPGAVAPPLAGPGGGGGRPKGAAVWIASNCMSVNWRRQLVSYLRRYVGIDSIGTCDTTGTAAVASFLAAMLTEMCLCNSSSCQEILRRNGSWPAYLSSPPCCCCGQLRGLGTSAAPTVTPAAAALGARVASSSSVKKGAGQRVPPTSGTE